MEILTLVRQLSERKGLGVVIVLHDINMATRFCDEIIALHSGRLMAYGGPDEIMTLDALERIYGVRMAIGAIFIDGIDIRDMTLKSLRSNIGIVQQDVFLFAGTIRENIAYGRLDASEAEIVEAARRARLDGVIADLPAGFDTLIGERGVKLSDGRSSVWRLPAFFSRTRRSLFWTRRHRRSTPKRNVRSSSRWPSLRRDAPRL